MGIWNWRSGWSACWRENQTELFRKHQKTRKKVGDRWDQTKNRKYQQKAEQVEIFRWRWSAGGVIIIVINAIVSQKIQRRRRTQFELEILKTILVKQKKFNSPKRKPISISEWIWRFDVHRIWKRLYWAAQEEKKLHNFQGASNFQAISSSTKALKVLNRSGKALESESKVAIRSCEFAKSIFSA